MKRIISVLVIAVMIISLTACTAELGSGGTPAPVQSSTKEWGEAVSKESPQITQAQAAPVLNDISELFVQMAEKTYASDLTQLKRASQYLAQFTEHKSEWAQYMHAFQLLCQSYYDMYVFNCKPEDVQKAIDDYMACFASLSVPFRTLNKPVQREVLEAVKVNVEQLALASISSEAESVQPSSTEQAEQE